MAVVLFKIFEEANLSGELKLSGRKLKDFPKAAAKYNLSDTVIAGKRTVREAHTHPIAVESNDSDAQVCSDISGINYTKTAQTEIDGIDGRSAINDQCSEHRNCTCLPTTTTRNMRFAVDKTQLLARIGWCAFVFLVFVFGVVSLCVHCTHRMCVRCAHAFTF